jgi:hypothetical protein
MNTFSTKLIPVIPVHHKVLVVAVNAISMSCCKYANQFLGHFNGPVRKTLLQPIIQGFWASLVGNQECTIAAAHKSF